jgi:hypothetical protein
MTTGEGNAAAEAFAATRRPWHHCLRGGVAPGGASKTTLGWVTFASGVLATATQGHGTGSRLVGIAILGGPPLLVDRVARLRSRRRAETLFPELAEPRVSRWRLRGAQSSTTSVSPSLTA